MADGGDSDGTEELTPRLLTGDSGETVESGVSGASADKVKHEATPAKSAKKVLKQKPSTNATFDLFY